MSAEENDQTYEAKLTVVDLPCNVTEEDGGALVYPLSNENNEPPLNNLTSLNTPGMGPASRSISLPSIICPIKGDKLDFSAALGLPLVSEDGKHERASLMCMGELGMKVDSSAIELVSCPGVVCLIKDDLKVSAAIDLPLPAEELDSLPSPDELQGQNFDSPASKSDSRSHILFLGSELSNAVSQDQDTNRRQFYFRHGRLSLLDWDQEKSPLSPDHEESRFKTLSDTDEPRKSYSYESSTTDTLDRPSTLCLESQFNDFSSLDTSRKENDFPATDPTALPRAHNFASQPHCSLVQESQEGQLCFPTRKFDIPDSESLALSIEHYIAIDPTAVNDEEHDLTNFPCLNNPLIYNFPPKDYLGQPRAAFLSKSRTLPNNSSSFMDMSKFNTEQQLKLSKWASFKNRLIGPPFLGPRVKITRIPEQINGHEVGFSREKDSPPSATLLGALNLEVPKNKKLMPWTRIKQAMLGKRDGDEDQDNYEEGGQGKGNRREKSHRMFGLGWMQKAFSTTKVVVEEVQEAQPNYPVDTYNTILDKEM